METRFTPGPWMVTRSDRRKTLCVISEDTWICGELQSDNPLAIPIVESEANARLIAAAPDLYEALNELLFEDSDKPEVERLKTLVKARAALAKARGEAE